MKSLSLPPIRQRVLSVALAGMCLPSLMQASIIMQADFQGSGGGTGGPNDIVAYGGTGTITSYTTGTASIQNSDPLGQGSYLNVSVGAHPANGNLGLATLTPTSAANSWSALNTVGSQFVALHGASDFFLSASNAGASGFNTNWTRPFDIGASSSGGLRFIMNAQGTNTMRLEFLAGTNAFLSGTDFQTRTSAMRFDAVVPGGAWALDTTYHFGFTFMTENDVVTVKLFGATGSQAIDTTVNTNLLGSTSFKIDATVVTAGLPSGAFSFNIGGTSGGYVAGDENTGSGAGRNVSGDALRLYNSAPASFGAIPEPTTMALLALGLVPIALRRRRPRA